MGKGKDSKGDKAGKHAWLCHGCGFTHPHNHTSCDWCLRASQTPPSKGSKAQDYNNQFITRRWGPNRKKQGQYQHSHQQHDPLLHGAGSHTGPLYGGKGSKGHTKGSKGAPQDHFGIGKPGKGYNNQGPHVQHHHNQRKPHDQNRVNDIKEFLDELGLSSDISNAIQSRVFGSPNDKQDAYKDQWQVIQSCKDRIRNFDSAIEKINESIDHMQEKIDQLHTKRQEVIDKRSESISQLQTASGAAPQADYDNDRFRSMSEWVSKFQDLMSHGPDRVTSSDLQTLYACVPKVDTNTRVVDDPGHQEPLFDFGVGDSSGTKAGSRVRARSCDGLTVPSRRIRTDRSRSPPPEGF